MDDATAAQMLRTLAAGDLRPTLVASPPQDADRLEESVLDLRRALFVAVDALEQRTRLMARRQAAVPRNSGKPWTAAEDEALLAKFDAGEPLAAIASAHERTRAGIEARLVKHGRLDERSARGGQGLRYATRERAPPG
jgi:hypothetical protein